MTKELKIEKLNPEARISVAEGDSPNFSEPCLISGCNNCSYHDYDEVI